MVVYYISLATLYLPTCCKQHTITTRVRWSAFSSVYSICRGYLGSTVPELCDISSIIYSLVLFIAAVVCIGRHSRSTASLFPHMLSWNMCCYFVANARCLATQWVTIATRLFYIIITIPFRLTRLIYSYFFMCFLVHVRLQLPVAL